MVDSEVIHYSRGVLEEEDKEIAVLEARLEPEVHLETGYGTVLFVDNTPVVAQDKYDKLVTVLLKVFNTCGKVAQPDGLFMPLNPATGKTEGFAIVEYETATDAHTALAKLRGYQLDKRHKFSIMPYTEFSHLLEVPDVFEEKKYPTYEPKFNPVWWLTDSRAMDQYVVRYGDETEIFWNETLRKPDPVYSRTLWTDSIVSWSPRGTYLATYHPKGVILWAGENWVKVDQFSHPDVKLVEFSPCESYMVTDSSDANQSNAIVWDIRSIGSSNLDRQQPISQRPFTPGPGGIKWSFDGQYFAMNNQSSICVYEAATMSLLDKKRLKMTDCKDFSWSPSDHIIAIASIPESTELPSRVVLVHIPTRTELATKTLFNVNKCSMHWQEQGNFLCVQVNRSAKKKAVATTNLEVFRMREKNIPIESLSFKDEVVSFAWEPVGKRFAMIHTEGTSTKSNVSFYEVGVKMKEIKKLENRQANQLFWSPKGSAIVLANFRSFAGALEFFNADLMQTMGEGEHMMATKLAWDPAGRFVATHVRMPQLETGYALWSFQGQLINKVLKDRFTQFAWRPRPPTLLSAEKQKEIKKNLSKYAKEYKKDEDDVVNIHIREDREKKAQYSKEFAQRMAAWKRLYDEEKPKRQSLRGGEASDNEEDWLTAVEEVEEVIEEIEESIQARSLSRSR